jgi:hypothetical protein
MVEEVSLSVEHELSKRILRSARGELTVERPAADILLTRCVGHFDEAFAAPLIAGRDQTLEVEGLTSEFHDWEKMTGYDPHARVALTMSALKARGRIGEFHLLTTSVPVMMGVSVANLALRRMMQIHRERGTFETALEAAIRQRDRKGRLPLGVP